MALSQSLQGFKGGWNHQEISVRRHVGRQIADNEVAHTAAIEVCNIMMAVVALGFQRKKQRLFRKTQRAAVSQQPPYECLGCAYATCSNERSNLFYCVIHSAKVLYFFRNSATFNIVLSIKARYSSESGLKGLCPNACFSGRHSSRNALASGEK